MTDYPFTITCTTCQAELRVREKSLIGQIVACPKCGSMVEVIAPDTEEGYPLRMEEPAPPEAPHRKVVPPPLPPSGVEKKKHPEASPETPAGKPAGSASGAPAESPSPTDAEPVAQATWRGRVWLIAAAVAVVVLLAGTYALIRTRRAPTPASPVAAEEQPEITIPTIWIPPDAELVVRGARSEEASPILDRILDAAGEDVKASVASFLKDFGLRREGIEEITVALAGGLSADRAVVTVRLKEGQDATLLEPTSKSAQFDLAGLNWLRRPSGWPRPYAILDKRTILTGPKDLLESIVGAGESGDGADSGSPLFAPLSDTWTLALVIRGEAWRDEFAPAASAWLGPWPKAADSWRKTTDLAQGLAWFASADPAKCRLGFESPDEARAGQLAEVVTGLLNSAAEALTPDKAIPPSELVGTAIQALKKGPPSEEGGVVWIETTSQPSPPAMFASILENTKRLQTWRLAAGRRATEQKQAAASGGILQYVQKHGHFPKGVAGQGLLPPETRLGWIASMLPFYGRPDWESELDFSYGWKDEKNARVTKRTLGAVVNPILGPQTDADGFPVTHFVGVAGVGTDAAELPADDPRAGIFGYDREIGLDDIEDGAANTLLLLGVVARTGPWAAGGPGSVRGISGRPIVNGPAGFGSGLPRGMVAAMADGSARFISRDIDPKVLEQMATIRGGGKQEPKPAGADVGNLEGNEAPPAVDREEAAANAKVKIRLAERIPRAVFRDQPVETVVKTIGEMGNFPIRFDEAALEREGISIETPVTVNRADASLDDLLKAGLEQAKLAYRIEKGGITVFPAK